MAKWIEERSCRRQDTYMLCKVSVERVLKNHKYDDEALLCLLRLITSNFCACLCALRMYEFARILFVYMRILFESIFSNNL